MSLKTSLNLKTSQADLERTKQQLKDMEIANRERMEQFKVKIKEEQEGQIRNLNQQMENERNEVHFKYFYPGYVGT